MKKNSILIVTLVLLLCRTASFAQQLTSSEQTKVNKLIQEAEQFKTDNNNIKLAETYNKIGISYWNHQVYNDAIAYLKLSLDLNKELKNSNAELQLDNYLGSIYSEMNNYKVALDYYQDALKINKRKGNKFDLATNYLNIGIAHTELQQTERAIKNLESAEVLANELTNFSLLKSISLAYIDLYKLKGDNQKQEDYITKYATYDKYLRSKEADSKLNHADSVVSNVLAKNYQTQIALSKSERELKIQDSLIILKSDSLKSVQKLTQEQELQLQLNDAQIKQQETELEKKRVMQLFYITSFIGFSLLLISLFYLNRQKQKNNILLTAKNEQINSQSEILKNQNLELRKLSIVAAKTDNAILIMDSKGNFEWVNESFTRIFGRTFDELVYDTPNIIGPKTPPKIVQIINKCLKDKETVYYNLEVLSATKRLLTIHVTLTPILNKDGEIEKIVAIDSDITEITKATEKIEEQHKLLEIQNENITSSISYAKTIQTASLYKLDDFNKVHESFLIYRPKDIVSGDFYWVHNLSEDRAKFNKFIIAVVDCTGHGVPGAFMSLIGIQTLNEIVKRRNIINPAQIINKLDQRIISVLQQETTENKDGMDLALALVEKTDEGIVKIVFAGAKRPLYVFNKAENELITLRGSRRSIGGISKTATDVEIKNYAIELKTGDSIYLTSDGLVDQPNKQRIRFGSGQFTDVLKSIGNKSMKDQKAEIIRYYKEHTHDTPQRDDITVLGIKF